MNSCCRSLYGHHRLLFATLVFLKMKEKTDSKVLSDEELRLLLTGGRVEERCVSQELFWEHGLTIYFFVGCHSTNTSFTMLTTSWEHGLIIYFFVGCHSINTSFTMLTTNAPLMQVYQGISIIYIQNSTCM